MTLLTTASLSQEFALTDQATLKQTPEAAMLARYQAGDELALDDLVATYQQPAFWVAHHLVRDHEIATDLVQEAFLKVLRRPESYDPTLQGLVHADRPQSGHRLVAP
jgi:DNA-directed RNA polymerase specialized sigma subunit